MESERKEEKEGILGLVIVTCLKAHLLTLNMFHIKAQRASKTSHRYENINMWRQEDAKGKER